MRGMETGTRSVCLWGRETGTGEGTEDAISLTQGASGGCGDTPPPRLHIACTDIGLREVVASWHRLSADVREKITQLARGG